MGFPSNSYCVVLPRSLVLLLLFLDTVSQLVVLVLCYLRVLPPDSAPLSFSHVPDPAAATIKARLPPTVLGEARGSACVFCLAELEARDEVRELRNCCHVFHKGCIDGWLDIGQLTCPLCRSPLLPTGKKVIRGGGGCSSDL